MKFVILILSLLLLGSCHEKIKSSKSGVLEIRTNALITKILSGKNDDYLDPNCKCIAENSKLILNRSGSLKGFVKRNLQIKDTNHLNGQIELFRNFKISKTILPQWNILSEKEFDLYRISSSDSSIWESLLIDCPYGYYSITKPIFNESYDRAIVGFGSLCRRLCGGGVTRIYRLINSEWVIEKEISSWVS